MMVSVSYHMPENVSSLRGLCISEDRKADMAADRRVGLERARSSCGVPISHA